MVFHPHFWFSLLNLFPVRVLSFPRCTLAARRKNRFRRPSARLPPWKRRTLPRLGRSGLVCKFVWGMHGGCSFGFSNSLRFLGDGVVEFWSQNDIYALLWGCSYIKESHERHKTKTTRKKSTTLLVRCAVPFLKTWLIESRHSRVAFHFALASIGDIVFPISKTHDVAGCHDEIPINILLNTAFARLCLQEPRCSILVWHCLIHLIFNTCQWRGLYCRGVQTLVDLARRKRGWKNDDDDSDKKDFGSFLSCVLLSQLCQDGCRNKMRCFILGEKFLWSWCERSSAKMPGTWAFSCFTWCNQSVGSVKRMRFSCEANWFHVTHPRFLLLASFKVFVRLYWSILFG